MFKKTVTYENFDGETVTEDFYFNLTEAELVELEVSEQGGFIETMQNIINAGNNNQAIVAGFKRLVMMSHGVKNENGKFYKDAQETAVFAASNAYSEIFMQLAENAEAGAEFVNAVLPRKLSAKLNETPVTAVEPAVVDVPLPAETPEEAPFVELTQAQLEQLPQDQLIAYFERRARQQ